MQNNDCIYNNSIVSLEEFNTYSGNYEDSKEVNRMKIQMLESAQSVVESYLNYRLESSLCVDEHIGFNNDRIYLNAKPVCNVNSVRVDGQDFEDYEFDFQSIYRTDGGLFGDKQRILIEYEVCGTNTPPLIKQTILRIATLMLMEAGENIGLTGKSATDGMSRTYISYNNYQKYLDPLKDYRVFRL